MSGDAEEGVLQPAEASKVDIVALLLHPANADAQWRQQAREALEAKELAECTFQPRIISKYESARADPRDKCVELYMRAKPLRERRDKTSDELEFEKGKDECTFHPNIGDSQRNLVSCGSQMYATNDSVKGFQSATQRL